MSTIPKPKIKVKLPTKSLVVEPPKLLRDKKILIHGFNVLINYVEILDPKTASFKARSYADAIKIIGDIPTPEINNYFEVVKAFHDAGKKNPTKVLAKIKEFIDTGSIKEVEEALAIPKVSAVMNLTKIYGIGPKVAMKLHDEYGISTINELKELVYGSSDKILNDKQLIGLSYFDDLQERIPRSEITEFETIIKELAMKISPDIKLSINGSYRRGLATSGDIDVLVTSPKGTTEKYRKQLISSLEKLGIIKETLASGKKKFMGIAFLSGKKARHIDIIETDPENFPFAVLYFTGSGGFNTWMRGYALSLGYSINEYTISHKDTMAPVSPEEITEKIGKPRFETEEDIFKFLGLEYVSPTERNDTTVGKAF